MLLKRGGLLVPHLFPPRSFRRFSNTNRNEKQYVRSSVVTTSAEVYRAVRDLRPVVALETTIYTHGFPYPDNVALASGLESIVRENGGIPATIGVLHGVARVGLSPDELIELTSAAGRPETMKISRRDLPYVLGLGMVGKKLNGGTTVAGTMILAHTAGIRIFGTGGLGGVHRGGESTMDISADLSELGKTPIAVISSGCKSFLDIPRTLEYLETQGVSVSTFADGRIEDVDFPAFWTRESGVKSPSVVQNEEEAAAIIFARKLLGLEAGLLFANPIPVEHSLPKSDIDRAIDEGIHGHANTPFILGKIRELTDGKSIPANKALIESNVARATRVAVAYSKLLRDENQESALVVNPSGSERLSIDLDTSRLAFSDQSDILVAGSVAVDLSFDHSPSNPNVPVVPHSSNPAILAQTVGGVGHNVATAAHLTGKSVRVRLCSIVADDLAGKLIMSSLKEKGIDVSSIVTLEQGSSGPLLQTAHYVAMNDSKKNLAVAMADMRIISSPAMEFTYWQTTMDTSKPKWVVVDTNWSEWTTFQWIKGAKRAGAKVAVEPVSVEKAKKLFPSQTAGEAYEKKGVHPYHDVDLVTPNEYELNAMYMAAKENGYFEWQDWRKIVDAIGLSSTRTIAKLQELTSPDLMGKGLPQRMIQLLPFMPNIVVKLGARGVLRAKLLCPKDPCLLHRDFATYMLPRTMTENSATECVYVRLFPPVETLKDDDIVSVNGAGDTFLGVIIAGLARDLRLSSRLINLAQRASVLTLKSKEAVNPDIASLAATLDRWRRGDPYLD